MRAWTFPGERLEARFFSPDVPKPQPTPTPPTDTTAIDEAEARERAAIRKRKGRAQNILTSPSGAPLGNAGGQTATPTASGQLGTTSNTLGVR